MHQRRGQAIQCAGFTPGEADQLRCSMATFKVTGGVSHFNDKLIGGMVANGYEQDFAERTFSQLEGFGSDGFPEATPPRSPWWRMRRRGCSYTTPTSSAPRC